MDNAVCNAIYLDRSAKRTGVVKKDDVQLRPSSGDLSQTHGDATCEETAQTNIQAILTVLDQVYVCSDGAACIAKISQWDDIHNPVPTVVFLDIPANDDARPARPDREQQTPSPTATRRPSVMVEPGEPEDLYGTHLLYYLCAEIHQRVFSKLVIPIAVLNSEDAAASHSALSSTSSSSFQLACDPSRMTRYLDAGAADVFVSPLSSDRVQGLAAHIYRVSKDVKREESGSVLTRRSRKLSWMGIDEERPYAYLREVMVSGLMEGICNPENVNDYVDATNFAVSPERKEAIEASVGSWSFSAHDFTNDELLHASLAMLQHALQMPELEQWRMSTGELTTFLLACRKAYNDFVLYHNFRHVVDVLQANFFFLLQIGVLPSYPDGKVNDKASCPVAALLTPFDALTLLISAVGHDVGHPGVNNAFLVALNAPLAQLYNDRSVLEAFHCAAYSQILRRYWPAAFSDICMRKLMINSILATDMGLHFKYIMDMGNLQEKLAANDFSTNGWSPKVLEETRDIACGLLIKCADISNIARKFDVAAQWAYILTDEFTNQGAMEEELNLPTCLFGGPPDRNDLIKMAESQLGFMNIFARPLFEGVTDILPDMRFSIDELSTNKGIWQGKIAAERLRRGIHPRGSASATPQAPSPMSKSTVSFRKKDSSYAEEDLPPLPKETEQILDVSQPSQNKASQAEGPTHYFKNQVDPFSPGLGNDRRRSSAMTIGSKTSRKPSVMSNAMPPLSYPFAQQQQQQQSYTQSRRSSKDAALDQLEQLQLGQRSSFSRLNDQSFNGARRGSADASLTTIVVHSQDSTETSSPTKASSPLNHSKQVSPPPQPHTSSSSDPSSIPSATSYATSDATAATNRPPSPSTDASSPAEEDVGAPGFMPPPAIPATENPFLHPNSSPDMSGGFRGHASAPAILDGRGASPGKTSVISQVTSEESDDRGDRRSDADHQLRESRSRSRLRGLKFWRHKRWKSPELNIEGSP